MTRLLVIAEYETLFNAAYPAVATGDLDFGHAATPMALDAGQFADLMAFVASLTDSAAMDLSASVPATVPSGLPVD